MITWISIFGMAAITFINRYLFLMQAIAYTPSAKVKRFLSFSSYAILTAIWVPLIIRFEPSIGVSHAGLDYLFAAVAAMSLAVARLPSILVVLISSGVFFALRWWLWPV